MKQLFTLLFGLGLVMFVVGVDLGQDALKEKLPRGNKCTKDGIDFEIGEVFEDPEHPCRTCECCETGFFKCHIKDCTKEPPPCGREHYEVVKDECCPQCSRMCDYIKNTTENCRTKKCEGIDAVAYYPDNKCCQECGCSWRGGIVPEGPITTPPTAACEGCTCSQGKVTCTREAKCPANRLHCVDPRVQDEVDNCSWHCPNGPTCFHGDDVILPDEYKLFGDKVCYCYKTWYPLAMCANKNHWGGYEERLFRDMCMKKPLSVDRWD